MPPSKPVQKLLQSQMSRREFLGFIGAALLAVVGVSGIIKGLNGLASRHVGQGYGSSTYGGHRDSRRL